MAGAGGMQKEEERAALHDEAEQSRLRRLQVSLRTIAADVTAQLICCLFSKGGIFRVHTADLPPSLGGSVHSFDQLPSYWKLPKTVNV